MIMFGCHILAPQKVILTSEYVINSCKAVLYWGPVASGNQHLVSSNLKKILVARLGTQLPSFPLGCAVKWETDCKITILVDAGKYSFAQHAFYHSSPFVQRELT